MAPNPQLTQRCQAYEQIVARAKGIAVGALDQPLCNDRRMRLL
jgi:hypothetical protein